MTGSPILHGKQTTGQQVWEVIFLGKKLRNIKVYGGSHQILENEIISHARASKAAADDKDIKP